MKLTFYGGAGEVGRSCILINSDKTRVLFDAGVKLGRIIEHPKIPVELIRELDAIFVSHAHLDHIGYLPHLFSAGFKGSVYVTKPTLELGNVVVNDYMRISEPKDVTKEGLLLMQKGFKVCEFKEEIKVGDMTFSFIPSGHIVGSSMITADDKKHRIIYSGDFFLSHTKLLEGADTRNLHANTLIIESTYGGKDNIFPSESVIAGNMMKSIKETILAGGKIIIPSFAVGRAEEILLLLDDYMNSGLIPKVDIYVDGMISKAMRIHRHNVIYCRKELQRRILMSDYDPFRSPNFTDVEGKNERSKIVKQSKSCVIVTTSGMLTGGPILYYLPHLASDQKNKIILVGYQAIGTRGRALQDGEKEIEIDRRKVKINMTVETHHLSAHADRKQLEALVGKIKDLKNVYVVHGEISRSEDLRTSIEAKGYKATVPSIGSEYTV